MGDCPQIRFASGRPATPARLFVWETIRRFTQTYTD